VYYFSVRWSILNNSTTLDWILRSFISETRIEMKSVYRILILNFIKISWEPLRTKHANGRTWTYHYTACFAHRPHRSSVLQCSWALPTPIPNASKFLKHCSLYVQHYVPRKTMLYCTSWGLWMLNRKADYLFPHFSVDQLAAPGPRPATDRL
jgi:hypothetical protein